MRIPATLIDAVQNGPPAPLPAGSFARWLQDTRQADTRAGGTDVPCGTCNACCRSAYFVHVAPDETDTLAHIPEALLFPAPGRPAGERVLGYDSQGRCAMLVDGACSIYPHRPRACRRFDCRVLVAAGVVPDETLRQDVAARAAQWQFQYTLDLDQAQHRAVKAAARFLLDHAGSLTAELPADAMQLAGRAIHLHELFMDPDAPPTREMVATALEGLFA